MELAAVPSEAARSLRSPVAFVLIPPQLIAERYVDEQKCRVKISCVAEVILTYGHSPCMLAHND
jgi:hypothetical protein